MTYFESSKFIPISDYQTAKKLENLCKIKSYLTITQDSFTIQNGALVFSEIEISNFKNKIGIPSNSIIVSVIPSQSFGYCEYATYNYESDIVVIGHIIPAGNPRNAIINVAYI